MNTPIKDFTDNYAKSGIIRAHMPGHKGKFPLTEFDITEIKGADSLFEADGIIAESEKIPRRYFTPTRRFTPQAALLSAFSQCLPCAL